MRGKRRTLLLCFFTSLLLAGCSDDSPLRYFVDPEADHSGGYSGTYIIYDDELKTRGGAFLFPEAPNQTLDFASQVKFSGRNAIRYSWNGGTVPDNGIPQNAFAGFSLIVASGFDTFDTTPAIDLSAAGYTQIRFYLKADLAPGVMVKIEAPDDGTGGFAPVPLLRASQDWTQETIAVNAAGLSSIKEFLKVTLVNGNSPTQSQGGTVYLDDIRYEQ